MTALRLALTLLAPLALAACGSGSDTKQKDQRTAAGEILPGSASDAMLPYDTVRSQPPLAPKATAKPGAKGAAADEAEASPSDVPAESTTASADAAAEPAAPAQ
jgi:hypothetical protein